MLSLLIKGGRVINPATGLDEVADVLIQDGIIKKIGLNLKNKADQVLEASGQVVCPGFIDMHVHLRDPGLEAKEDIVSGSKAAAAGGFTGIACMPNTRPVIDTAIVVDGILRRAERDAAVRVHVIGAMTKGEQGKELAEIGDMIEAGACAISDDGHDIGNAKVMRTGLEYTSMFDRIVITHAEDVPLVEEGVIHEGEVSARLGLKGRPAVAEDIAVARNIMLAEYTNSAVHIAHMSTKGAVELVRQAKAKGLQVTAEVTPHHLSLTDEAVIGYNTATKVAPPLRSMDHVEALRQGLKDGTIDAIATDHAPHAFEDKDREYKEAPFGFTGLETALGVILTECYHTGLMTLPEIIEKMATAPAKLLRLPLGTLAEGQAADITVFDPNQEWTVDSKQFYTRGKATPFDGKTLKGKAVATIVKGQLVMKNGEVLK